MMISEIILRYIHFISVFAIVASIVGEHLLLKESMTRREIRRIAVLDSVYGVAVITLLGAGLTLWLSTIGKPAEFYSKNWIFHLKLTLFVLIGLLSIIPTVFFAKNRKGDLEEVVEIPNRIKWAIRLELLILFVMPITATLMAKGIGLS